VINKHPSLNLDLSPTLERNKAFFDNWEDENWERSVWGWLGGRFSGEVEGVEVGRTGTDCCWEEEGERSGGEGVGPVTCCENKEWTKEEDECDWVWIVFEDMWVFSFSGERSPGRFESEEKDGDFWILPSWYNSFSLNCHLIKENINIKNKKIQLLLLDKV
jgi:hypothetical protein